jgi:hypothetical protein
MKMHSNHTLAPGPGPKRQLFIDTDTLVEWDIHIEHRVHQAEKVQIAGLECGPPDPCGCDGAWGAPSNSYAWSGDVTGASGTSANLDTSSAGAKSATFEVTSTWT